jgi:phage FluMu protein Com
MPIEFRCPQCEKLLRTPDGTSGRQAKCPQCGALTTIPDLTPAATRAADPLAELPSVTPPPAPNPFQSPHAEQMRATPEFEIRRGFQPTRIDLGDVMGRAWRIYKANFGICLGATLLVLAINYAVAFGVGFGLSFSTRNAPIAAQQSASAMTNILAQVLGIWLFMGLMVFLLKICRGESAPFADIFSGGPYLLRGIGVNILFILAVTIGFLLLIFPAFIAMTMFGPAFVLLVDQQTGVLESMRMSRTATRGNKLTLFALYLLCLVIAFVGLLMCGVGMFLAQPYIMLVYVVSYLAMTGQSTADSRP